VLCWLTGAVMPLHMSSTEKPVGDAQVADWPSAETLLGALAGAGMQPAAVPEVARALCAAVSQRLAPRLAALYPDGPRGRCLLDRYSQGQKQVCPRA